MCFLTFGRFWQKLSNLEAPNGRANWAWNETIPTPHGTAPNDIATFLAPQWLDIDVYKLWANTAPLVDVLHGCRGRCEAQIRAPILFPTSCSTREVAVSYVEQYDLKTLLAQLTAPPLNTYQLLITSNLVVEEHSEKIALTTGWTRVQEGSKDYRNCKTTLTLETCLLEAGIGEFDIIIEGNEIDMTSLSSPRLVALSNNTEVDHGVDPLYGWHPSTLAGIVSMMWGHWDTLVSDYKERGHPPVEETAATIAVELYENKGAVCTSYRDPRSDYMASLNRLT